MRYRFETARVVGKSGGRIILRMLSPDESRCARCGLCSRAGEGNTEAKEMPVPEERLPWRPDEGDLVRVAIPDVPAVLAGLVVLGLPLGGALGGLVAALGLGVAGWGGVAFGAGGFALGVLTAYMGWGRRHDLKFMPEEGGE